VRFPVIEHTRGIFVLLIMGSAAVAAGECFAS
jgi:hypothetical protein